MILVYVRNQYHGIANYVVPKLGCFVSNRVNAMCLCMDCR